MVKASVVDRVLTSQRAIVGNPTARYIAGDLGVITSLPVVAGEGAYDTTTDEGLIESHESRTFTIKATDLAIGGSEFLPQRRHKIEESGQRYEVMSIGGGNHYEWFDNARSYLVVHCVAIGTA